MFRKTLTRASTCCRSEPSIRRTSSSVMAEKLGGGRGGGISVRKETRDSRYQSCLVTHVSVAVPVAEAVVVGAEPEVVVEVEGVGELGSGVAGARCPCGKWGMSAVAGTRTAGRRHERCGHRGASWHLTESNTSPPFASYSHHPSPQSSHTLFQ
ncbi:hypothetical protein E2C01_007645 [Portunus trituberculatus]|uniref:Uncharacterized protein n=1 Tax=Portunus trituberculatus TaxID=210409 RepID=A0A5B7CZT4_PORTR|nr:hypothetical protein [Portunus trituberculatus]